MPKKLMEFLLFSKQDGWLIDRSFFLLAISRHLKYRLSLGDWDWKLEVFLVKNKKLFLFSAVYTGQAFKTSPDKYNDKQG